MRFISISTYSPTSRLPTEAEMASMHKLIVEGMKAGWLIECEGVTFGTTGVRVHNLPGARSRSPTALSPRLKRSSAATPSSTPRARKKQLNTRGVSSTTSARKPAREPGRPTRFSRCRREKDSSFSEQILRGSSVASAEFRSTGCFRVAATAMIPSRGRRRQKVQ